MKLEYEAVDKFLKTYAIQFDGINFSAVENFISVFFFARNGIQYIDGSVIIDVFIGDDYRHLVLKRKGWLVVWESDDILDIQSYNDIKFKKQFIKNTGA